MSNNDSAAEGPADREEGKAADDSRGELIIESVDALPKAPPDTGRLLDPWQAEAVEAEDRRNPIPGGEPECPSCGAAMTRHVEKHPAPRAGATPFRVRLVCSSEACSAWTVYDW
ncbi:MAG: hypothetical protein PVF05_03585 [Gemmatimonadales bacterium]|jgi:hypothetical protein